MIDKAQRARRPTWLVLIAAMAVTTAFGRPTSAEPASEPDARAREEFRAGAKLVEASEWAAALAAFERSRAIREHVLAVYNIGVCQRYLGRYTLARETLRESLQRSEGKAELPDLFRQQAEGYIAEIESKLARVSVTLKPAEASIAFDGRPLATSPSGEWVAGVAPPGQGKGVGSGRFVVIADPGSHVLTFQLEGHDTIEIRRELKPGSAEDLAVSLTEQNAEIQIDSDRPQAVVRVDDVDIGLTPAVVTRPPGVHAVTVAKNGFVTYRAALTLRPGQHMRLAAELPVERIPLTKRWWFWTGAAVVVTTGVLITYAVTRPAPDPPPYQAGSTGWVVPLP